MAGGKRTASRWKALTAKYPMQCVYCSRDVAQRKADRQGGHIARATLEHLIPRWMGGRDCLSNLRIACYRCNGIKNTEAQALFKTIEDGGGMTKTERVAYLWFAIQKPLAEGASLRQLTDRFANETRRKMVTKEDGNERSHQG